MHMEIPGLSWRRLWGDESVSWRAKLRNMINYVQIGLLLMVGAPVLLFLGLIVGTIEEIRALYLRLKGEEVEWYDGYTDIL